MLERIDLSEQPLDKESYKALRKDLTRRLISLQQEAVQNGCGLVVLFEGWDGAGKGSRLSDLLYNLDARATKVHVPEDVKKHEVNDFEELNSGVRGYDPFMKEYWQALGPRGHITFFDQGWYMKAVQRAIYSKDQVPTELFQDAILSAHDFEQQLVDNGYVLVKFFLHVSKESIKKRLHLMAKDPATSWRVSKRKLEFLDYYDDAYVGFDTMLERSNYSFAPWTLVNAESKRIANITILKTMIDALSVAITRKKAENKLSQVKVTDENDLAETRAEIQHSFAPMASEFAIEHQYPIVENISHELSYSPELYDKHLKRLQKEIFELQNLCFQKRIPVLVMYEGWDAAGKGGAIKRLAQSLDARSYSIIPSPKPSVDELAHPHLWRYWTRLPKAGHVGIFDRSWYGRVLVERVEEITKASDWARGYDEINEFERDLLKWGAILIKFWVNVSQAEQLNRFKARQEDPDKQWKITDEDWRNRDKYVLYKSAIDDMFRLTSTEQAPWFVLESDDKLYARIKSLTVIRDAMKERLDG